ncbi:MAG: YitT family protein [Ruminococcaceae bacterium]|nr:YitT family protein [Oscillospiraceae bacterium]
MCGGMSMLKKIHWKSLALDVVFILAGSICYAVAIGMFSAPNDIAPGGLTGIATLLNELFDWIPIGTATIVMNVPLIIASWFVLSKSMAIRTLWGIAVSSILVDVMEPWLTKHAYTEDKILVCIFGGAILGLGVGLILRRGGTTGGSEVISRLLEKKYPHMSVGTLILVVDAIVITLSAIVYRNPANAMYAVVFVFIGSQIIDRVVYGGRSGKMVMIISEQQPEITQAIMTKVQRGVTLLKSQGGYSGQDKNTILVAVRRDEVFRLRQTVFAIDPDAFLMMLTTDEVRGLGFMNPHEE